MRNEQYQNLVWQGYGGKGLSQREIDINNALGVVGEAGEVADFFKKRHFIGREMSENELMEELGDVLWHITCIASAHGFLLSQIMEYNIRKLEKRYGDTELGPRGAKQAGG